MHVLALYPAADLLAARRKALTGKSIAAKIAVTFIILLVIGTLVDIGYVGTFGAAYDPTMKCGNPTLTTIATITANTTFRPIPNKRALNPPCSSFVQLSSVSVIPGSIQWGGQQNFDCAIFLSGVYCDTTFNVNQTGTGPFNWIHIEIDQNWKANGIAPPDIPQQCQSGCRLTLTGFVYWDGEHVTTNNGNGWEIHPLASWTLM